MEPVCACPRVERGALEWWNFDIIAINLLLFAPNLLLAFEPCVDSHMLFQAPSRYPHTPCLC
jgi:hypothetical protein